MIISKQIYSFLRVVECGSFSKAAELLFISVPALTQQISLLERDLGVTLLNRTHQGTVPTQAGKYFYEEMKQVVSKLDKLQADIQAMESKKMPSLNVSFYQSFDQSFMYRIFSAYQQRYHDTLHIMPYSFSRTIQEVIDHHADICYTTSGSYIRSTGLQIVPLLSITPFLSVPSGHPLSARKTVELQDLNEMELVLPEEGFFDSADMLCKELDQLQIPFSITRITPNLEVELYCLQHQACRLTVRPTISKQMVLLPLNTTAKYTTCLAYHAESEMRLGNLIALSKEFGMQKAQQLKTEKGLLGRN